MPVRSGSGRTRADGSGAGRATAVSRLATLGVDEACAVPAAIRCAASNVGSERKRVRLRFTKVDLLLARQRRGCFLPEHRVRPQRTDDLPAAVSPDPEDRADE